MASAAKSEKNGTKTGSAKAAEASGPKLTTSDMEAQIEALKAEIAGLRSHISASGERSFEALKTIATEGIQQAKAQGEVAMQNLRDNADDIEAQVAAAVREKPVTSLAIAAGVGFLFALIARR